MYSFTGAISQKLNDVCNKMLYLVLKYVENCQSGVLFVAFGCLDGQSLVQQFTKFDRVCITASTRQPTSSRCEECVEGLPFHVPCFAAVV